jgi:hypothetical protein
MTPSESRSHVSTMHLTDIPVEVFLDNLLPFASARDVLSFGSTNKLFAAICADETFWRRRCHEDFNFTSQETARQSGWKTLYRGLNHPRIFVWGFVTMPVRAAQTMMLFPSFPASAAMGDSA